MKKILVSLILLLPFLLKSQTMEASIVWDFSRKGNNKINDTNIFFIRKLNLKDTKIIIFQQ